VSKLGEIDEEKADYGPTQNQIEINRKINTTPVEYSFL
jgi:hypothetical protein|tara:strand:- start:1716 stop:1829 length:114 start_codon:yes stop_codon:yes gene_type:complete